MAVIVPIISKYDDSGLKKLKGSFGGIKKLVGPLIASIGAIQIGSFLKSSITAASDFNEQGAAVTQIFGKASTEIQKFADAGAKSLGQSKVQILEAAKSFGIYGKAAGLAGTKNTNFSTELVTLATDLASFNNTSVDDAIQALGAGLRGESEPLRRYGILLNDAALKAEAMNLKIYSGKGPLTQQAKILAANSAIFKQSKTQQGDFARTSGGLANQQRILTAEFENMKIKLGTALMPMIMKTLPIINKMADAFNKNVLPAIETFFKDLDNPNSNVSKTLGPIKDAFIELGTAVSDFGKSDMAKEFGPILSATFLSALKILELTLLGIAHALEIMTGVNTGPFKAIAKIKDPTDKAKAEKAWNWLGTTPVDTRTVNPGSSMSNMSTVTINVNGVVGDKASVGKAVKEAMTAYDKKNGSIYRGGR